MADKKKAFTFALPNEKMGGQKRPKDLWKFGNNSTIILIMVRLQQSKKTKHKSDVNFNLLRVISQIEQFIYNGEFDPGSGWTLAAGLIHASRGAAGL